MTWRYQNNFPQWLVLVKATKINYCWHIFFNKNWILHIKFVGKSNVNCYGWLYNTWIRKSFLIFIFLETLGFPSDKSKGKKYYPISSYCIKLCEQENGFWFQFSLNICLLVHLNWSGFCPYIYGATYPCMYLSLFVY